MKGLANKKIGIAADRQSEAIALLIQKQGGIPETHPIQGERVLNEKTCNEDVEALINGSFDWVVFTTGIGADALIKASEQLGKKELICQCLQRVKLAVRGRKASSLVKEYGLSPLLTADDGTMDHLLSQFHGNQSRGERLFLQLYDQDEEALERFFTAEGFTVYLSKPYRYKKPEQSILDELADKIVHKSMDAVVFTSKAQVHNLFQQSRNKTEIIKAFNDKVLAAAIGKVTAGELARYGIEKCIQPENQKMGEMIVRLSQYFEAGQI